MLAKYYQYLKEYLSFRTVCGNNYQEFKDCVDWLKEKFVENDFEVKIFSEYKKPILLAEYRIDDKYKDLLIYGHYDVQLANEEGWKFNPFSLYISDKKIYGRGVVDNKGQLLIHILVLFKLIQEGKLKCNIKFLVEGEEEIGSNSIKNFIQEKKDLLTSDIFLISDGEIHGNNPVIDVGFRGGFNANILFSSCKSQLHSGLYGGVVPNIIFEISKIINQLYDNNNLITIPYFYYDVDEIESDILVMNKKREQNIGIENLKKNIGVKKIIKEKNLDYYSQVGLRPTIQITGISGGDEGKNNINIIPNKVSLNLNFRLVESQNSKNIVSSFQRWLEKVVPNYLDYELKIFDSFDAIKIDNNNKYIEYAVEILQKIYDNKIIYNYCGGSLPVVKYINDYLDGTILNIPLGNTDCNMHGVNENFTIENINKGFEFSYEFHKNIFGV